MRSPEQQQSMAMILSSRFLTRQMRAINPLTPITAVTRSYFIKTETTPNPESIKFLPDTVVLPPEYGTGMVS